MPCSEIGRKSRKQSSSNSENTEKCSYSRLKVQREKELADRTKPAKISSPIQRNILPSTPAQMEGEANTEPHMDSLTVSTEILNDSFNVDHTLGSGNERRAGFLSPVMSDVGSSISKVDSTVMGDIREQLEQMSAGMLRR